MFMWHQYWGRSADGIAAFFRMMGRSGGLMEERRQLRAEQRSGIVDEESE